MKNETGRISTHGGSRAWARGSHAAVVIFATLLCLGAASPSHAEEPTAPGAESGASERSDDEASPSDVALREARQLSDEKRFDEAATKLRGALRKDPRNKNLLSLLARVLAWSRRHDESIATYRELLQLEPDDAFDRAGYARVLSWSGRSHESVREFRRAVAGDSTDLESRIGYARALSWDGDLAGASKEYFRILEADSNYGDAWLGLATVARWRRAATASDAFVEKAAARGADPEGVQEERDAVRLALRPQLGAGWTRNRERQITSDSTAFQLEMVGDFVHGRATLGRSMGLVGRASRLHLWERSPGLPTDTTLNYDLKSSVFSGDLSLTRYYPIQLSAGLSVQRLEARSGRVLFPLREDDDFVGFNSRVWGYIGRVTPSLSVRHDFIAIKETSSTTGARTLVPGGVTNAEGTLRWDWNGHGSVTGLFSKGTYTDDNDRSTVSGTVAYRVNHGQPRLTLDYGLAWSDFARGSSSYFTPLQGVKHSAGLSANGYSERAAIDYGARYQFSYLRSSNFDDIATNVWSGYADAIVFDAIPLGAEGYYSVDNHSYRTWGVTLSASARW